MLKNKLQRYFPMIRTRSEVMDIINATPKLRRRFYGFSEEMQEAFLDFCSGAKGIKILYDSFFKEVLNPEYAPERLNWLLSVILGMKVKIVQVLPLDSSRIGDETSLVAMDIVVELEDGSIVNVEMQKIGYLFPGQRSACYAADLLLRQYKRIRGAHKEGASKFQYSEIKPVYTIVFFEQSPKEFHQFPENYIHYAEQVTNTGLKLELLQKYVFIPLDIFHKVRQNKSINSELDAWLLFLSSDEVEDIVWLIENYPEFKPMYETLYRMCVNVEEVMGMFSKELFELDKNTAEFMVDQLSRENEEQKETIEEQKGTIEEQKGTIEEQKDTIEELRGTNEALLEEIARLKAANGQKQ